MREMEEALGLAGQGIGRTSPNPAVGAVLARGGEIVGRGYHTYAGVKHAEILAIEEAGERARGATLFVTLEPCSHQGRTPPCADALIAAGVSKVVAAMQDPNPRVSGQGFRKLIGAGIGVEIASEYTDRAEAINQPFIHFMRTGRPLVTLKSAVTLDGKIAAPEDNRGWITSERARAHVQTLRHQSDAILTGIGTVLADDCLLTDRSGLPRSRPLLRVIMDSQCRLPVESKIVQTCQDDVLVVTTTAAPADRRKRLEARGVKFTAGDGPLGRASLQAAVGYLSAHAYQSLMIEAGSRMNWAALESGLTDKIYFYYAPKILGGLQSLPVAGGTGRARRADAMAFRGVRIHQIEPDEFAVEAWMVKEKP